MTTKRVPLSQLHISGIRHPSLPPELVSRVEQLAQALPDAHPQSLAEWLDGFQRDANPAREIAIWEVIALANSSFAHQRVLSPEERQEALGLLLHISLGEQDSYILEQPLQLLTLDDRKQLLSDFSAARSSLGTLDQIA
jgi:hypothetical protein